MPRALLPLLVLALVGVRLGVDPLAAEFVGVASAVLAAMSFSPGDPPRRPWLLRALAVGLVLVAHGLQRAELASGARVDLILLIVANLLGAAAILGFLQVVRRSGLSSPLTRGEKASAAALGAATLALVGWILAALATTTGSPDTLRVAVVAVSTLADAVVFAIAALLLRLVLPLRGGLVAQPYLLLAADGLCFLLVDLALVVELDPAGHAVAIFGALGWSAGAVAGMSQAALVRRYPRRAADALR